MMIRYCIVCCRNFGCSDNGGAPAECTICSHKNDCQVRVDIKNYAREDATGGICSACFLSYETAKEKNRFLTI